MGRDDGKDATRPCRGGRRCSRRAARESRRAHVPISAATAFARLTPIVLLALFVSLFLPAASPFLDAFYFSSRLLRTPLPFRGYL